MQRVGLEHFKKQLLALSIAKLRMLREGAVNVSGDDVIHLLLPYADLQQRVVPPLLGVLNWDGPGHMHDRVQ